VDVHIADDDVLAKRALHKLLTKRFEATAWPAVDVVNEKISPVPSLMRTAGLQDLKVRSR